MSDREINIPVELTESGMSLEEIGFAVVMYAAPKMSKQRAYEWTNDEHFQKVGDELERRKILNKLDGGSVRMDIPERKFWTVDGLDDNANEILISRVPSEEGACGVNLWCVSPCLRGGKIVWENDSDIYLRKPDDMEYFSSLDEAQEYFEMRNIEILEEIKKNGSDK